MRKLIAAAACLLAGTAWAQQKVTPVVVTNPSLTVQAADAGRYTHVGQKPSRIVELSMLGSSLGLGYPVDPATGFLDPTTDYIVPDGFQFVLTDITGVSDCGLPGSTFAYAVRNYKPGLTSDPRTVFLVVCSSDGRTNFERHFTTGLLMGAGNGIVVTNLGSNAVVKIHGYLVPTG